MTIQDKIFEQMKDALLSAELYNESFMVVLSDNGVIKVEPHYNVEWEDRILIICNPTWEYWLDGDWCDFTDDEMKEQYELARPDDSDLWSFMMDEIFDWVICNNVDLEGEYEIRCD